MLSVETHTHTHTHTHITYIYQINRYSQFNFRTSVVDNIRLKSYVASNSKHKMLGRKLNATICKKMLRRMIYLINLPRYLHKSNKTFLPIKTRGYHTRSLYRPRMKFNTTIVDKECVVRLHIHEVKKGCQYIDKSLQDVVEMIKEQVLLAPHLSECFVDLQPQFQAEILKKDRPYTYMVDEDETIKIGSKIRIFIAFKNQEQAQLAFTHFFEIRRTGSPWRICVSNIQDPLLYIETDFLSIVSFWFSKMTLENYEVFTSFLIYILYLYICIFLN